MKDNIVEVRIWDYTVGLLSWDDKRGCFVFQFDLDFVQRGLDIAPLTAPIESPYMQKAFPMFSEFCILLYYQWYKSMQYSEWLDYGNSKLKIKN